MNGEVDTTTVEIVILVFTGILTFLVFSDVHSSEDKFPMHQQRGSLTPALDRFPTFDLITS